MARRAVTDDRGGSARQRLRRRGRRAAAIVTAGSLTAVLVAAAAADPARLAKVLNSARTTDLSGLTYALGMPGGKGGLCLVTPTGTRRLTGPARDHAPAWSHDGSRVAFARDVSRADATDIFTAKANGRGPRDLTAGYATTNTDPSWSPDGRQIVFVASAHGGTLAVMNAGGSGKRSLDSTTTGFEIESPSWSPNGQWIAYSVDVGLASPNRGIYVVHPDGSGKRQLLLGGFDPRWSPNGKQIVYAVGTDPSGSRGIAVMTADGSHGHTIVSVRGATRPEWSPDGRRIAYTVTGRNHSTVYVASVKRRSVRRAVRGAFDATWRPASPLPGAARECVRGPGVHRVSIEVAATLADDEPA